MEKSCLRKIASKKTIRLAVLLYAVASRSNPKHCAKLAGRPWSATRRKGASDGRALRASRCSQDRRQCARFARVKTISEDSAVGEHGGGMELSITSTASLRITLSQARRMPQRGQSFQRTEARDGTADVLAWAGGEESSGQSTALTRRGLIVVLLS